MYVGKHIVKKNKKKIVRKPIRAQLKPPKKERKYVDISFNEMKYCLFPDAVVPFLRFQQRNVSVEQVPIRRRFYIR